MNRPTRRREARHLKEYPQPGDTAVENLRERRWGGRGPRDRIAYEPLWSPQPGPQVAALQCPIQDLFYGGARGGGKTDFLLSDWVEHANRWGQYAKGILFRRTYTELEEVIHRSKELFAPLGAKYNEQSHTWTFPKHPGMDRGAVLKLRYLRRESDADVYQGHSYTWEGFDELGNWPSPVPIDKLWACLRSADVPSHALARRSTGNPGGPGHGWVKARYVTPDPGGYAPFKYQPQPELAPLQFIEAVYIPAKLTDNPLLEPEKYLARLAAAAMGNAALYKAWVDGNWDVFVGQAFQQWDHNVHVGASTTQHLNNRIWYVAMDWGFALGWAGLCAVDPEEGYVEVVSEFYWGRKVGRPMQPSDVALAMCRKWEKFPRPDAIIADDEMWQAPTERGSNTLIKQFARGLLRFYGKGERPRLEAGAKGRGSRKAKYLLMHKYLHWENVRNELGQLKPWCRPLLTVQRRCEHLVRTLPALPVDPDSPDEDVDTDAEDHPYDGLCNLLLKLADPRGKAPDPIGVHQHPGFVVKGKAKGRRKPRWEEEVEAEEEAVNTRYDQSWYGRGGGVEDEDG